MRGRRGGWFRRRLRGKPFELVESYDVNTLNSKQDNYHHSGNCVIPKTAVTRSIPNKLSSAAGYIRTGISSSQGRRQIW